MAVARDIEAAVRAAQLYLGSFEYVSMRDQQRFYDRMSKRIAAVARRRGIDGGAVYEQITTEARRRGAIRPQPGKDL